MRTGGDPAVELADGTTWNEFCDALRKAAEVLQRPDIGASTFELAEGHRYLGRLLRAGLMSFGERSGSRYPVFRAMPDGVKMGLDNPDNFYVSATVGARHSYRIVGRRGSIHYLSFAAQSQNFAARESIAGGAGHLDDADLRVAADGTFEIIASQHESPGNWLRMGPQTSQILVRQTFLDRRREAPVDLNIECLDGDGPPPPLDPAGVRGQLLGAAMYAIGCAQWFADWVVDFDRHAAVNQFHLPDPEQHRIVGGDPNVRIWLGRWQIADGAALVVDLRPPRCHYWNFQLGNIWAESLEYRYRRTHINSGQAATGADGTVRLVVAAEDPGADNWIDTAGHQRGTMCVRWVRADGHPKPRCAVVRLDEIRRGAYLSTDC